MQEMKLQPEALARLPQIACFGHGICPRVDEMRYTDRFGNQLVQQLQPLRTKLSIQSRHARDVGTRSVQACNKSNLDWVAPNLEDDRNNRGRCLCGECRRSAGSGNHAHLTTNKISCECRQSVNLALR